MGPDVPLSLALESTLPVVALGMGLVFLARIVQRADVRMGELAIAGVVLSIAGGVAHSAWKLTLATTEVDAEILERALLGCLMPGFLFVSVAFAATTGVERARRAGRILSRMAVMLLVLGLAFGMSQSGVAGLELALAVVTLIAAATLFIQVINVARSRRLGRVVILTAIAFTGSLVAGVFGAMEFTVARAWADQSIRTIAHITFAYAAWLLSRRYVAEPNQAGGAEPGVEPSDR